MSLLNFWKVIIPSPFRFVVTSQVKSGNSYPQMTHDKLKYLSREIRNGKDNRHSRCVADLGIVVNFEMEIKMN